MKRNFAYITFDCYGTLIDWETGISTAVIQAAGPQGVDVTRERVLELHARIEPEVQRGPFKTYREVLAEVAVRVAKELGWKLKANKASYLPDSLPSWTPFPDVNPALERLVAGGIKLGILSNVDDDLLAGTLRHFTVPFDLLVTAQQLRSYKPAAAHFECAAKQLDGHPWLHAAQSYFHDVEPAVTLKIPVVWVNRKHERARGMARPDAEVDSVAGLADLLGME